MKKPQSWPTYWVLVEADRAALGRLGARRELRAAGRADEAAHRGALTIERTIGVSPASSKPRRS